MKTTLILVLLTIILSLVTLVPLTLSELCHPQDKQALLQIKKAFKNPKLYYSWNPNTDCCSWKWVGCDPETNRIFDFYIYDTHETISGSIPSEIGDLPYLSSIEIHAQPYLIGPIPIEITKLQRLVVFSVSRTSLSGSVPSFLSEIKSLAAIILYSNNLTGPIPSSLSLLPNLTDLSLERNKLTGSIPSSFSRLTKLNWLTLDRNKLTGKLPAWLSENKFRRLGLSRNKLEGDASTLFSTSTKRAWSVDLSRNLLDFNLSMREYFPKGFIFLDISNNNLIGDFPMGITALDNLRRAKVSRNGLSGKIPAGRLNPRRHGYSSVLP